LSYSGGGGAKSFGNRGFSSRKEKKKKQDFHKHHLKYTPEEHASLDQLKERASIGLQRLGTQIFSSEPGGYGFHNWMASFNLLLDDFEEKCNPSSLPKEYFDARLALSAKLLEPVDTSAQDSQIKQLEQEILHSEETIADTIEKSERIAVEEWHRDESKISRLRREKTQTDVEITKTKDDLEEEKKKAAAQSLFKRMFSNSEAVKGLQTKLVSLDAKIEDLEAEIKALEDDRSKKQSDVKKIDSEVSRLRSDLEELKLRLGEVETQKQEALQIAERRSEITKSMAEMISSLHFGNNHEDKEEAEPTE